MNLTININIPEKLASEGTESPSILRTLQKPKEEDYHQDGVTPMLPVQGQPIAMLLFALTRATTTDANHLMTPAQQTALNDNYGLYEIFKGSGAGAEYKGNAIKLFTEFVANAPNPAEVVATFQAAQKLYMAYRKYLVEGQVLDKACELKYSQLANIAQIDWRTYE
jgi:hypothetical protein